MLHQDEQSELAPDAAMDGSDDHSGRRDAWASGGVHATAASRHDSCPPTISGLLWGSVVALAVDGRFLRAAAFALASSV